MPPHYFLSLGIAQLCFLESRSKTSAQWEFIALRASSAFPKSSMTSLKLYFGS